MSTLLETWGLFQELQPFQAPDLAREDAMRFGPSQIIVAGQAVAVKTSDGFGYGYSTGTITATAPGAPAGTPITTSGTLAAGTYFALITALYGTGESKKGTESAQITLSGTGTITWTWTAIAGATGYRFYRTATNGATTTETLLTSVPAGVTTLVDNGGFTLGATTPPSANSAAPTDGTQTCVGLSRYSFVTDALGNAYLGYNVTPGGSFAAAPSTRTAPLSTMPFFYRGTFNLNDLTGFDAAAQTTMQVRTKPNGAILIP